MLRLKQVQEKIGLSRSAIYDRMNMKSPRYDSSFPKAIRLGCNAKAVGWVEDKVEAWLRSQIAI